MKKVTISQDPKCVSSRKWRLRRRWRVPRRPPCPAAWSTSNSSWTARRPPDCRAPAGSTRCRPAARDHPARPTRRRHRRPRDPRSRTGGQQLRRSPGNISSHESLKRQFFIYLWKNVFNIFFLTSGHEDRESETGKRAFLVIGTCFTHPLRFWYPQSPKTSFLGLFTCGIDSLKRSKPPIYVVHEYSDKVCVLFVLLEQSAFVWWLWRHSYENNGFLYWRHI